MAKGSSVLEFVENDLLPFLDVEWEDQDITGFDIKLHIRKPNGLTVTKTAVIDDANAGNVVGVARFHFEWTAGDLIAGESSAEIEVFDALLKNETFQGLVLKVSKEIA